MVLWHNAIALLKAFLVPAITYNTTHSLAVLHVMVLHLLV